MFNNIVLLLGIALIWETTAQGWTTFGDSEYILINTLQSWQTSRDACKALGSGSDMVTIKSAEEQEFVKNMMPTSGNRWQWLWIGLLPCPSTGAVCRTSKWVDGTEINYLNWSGNQAVTSRDGCSEIYAPTNYQWHDNGCNVNSRTVCKRSGFQIGPLDRKRGHNQDPYMVNWRWSAQSLDLDKSETETANIFKEWGKKRATTTTTTKPSEGVHVVHVVNVKATDLADVSFWNTHCSKIPADAAHVKIVMGSVVDYYKPITGLPVHEGLPSTFCQMLTSSSKHKWSPDGENWEIPRYSYAGHLGGSGYGFPRDGRKFLSFWGTKYSSAEGGCCYNSYSSRYSWKQSFDLYYDLGRVPSELERKLTTCTTAKALCDTNLAKERSKTGQTLEDAIGHHSDIASEKFPDQAAVGNVMGEYNKGSIPSFMDRLIFLGIGAGLYALMTRAFAKKSGDEYNSLVEI